MNLIRKLIIRWWRVSDFCRSNLQSLFQWSYELSFRTLKHCLQCSRHKHLVTTPDASTPISSSDTPLGSKVGLKQGLDEQGYSLDNLVIYELLLQRESISFEIDDGVSWSNRPYLHFLEHSVDKRGCAPLARLISLPLSHMSLNLSPNMYRW